MENAGRTPAQLYALVVGVVLTIAGIIGFFYSAAFGTPGKVAPVLGVLDVNGWHNVVHLASGLLGLAVMGSVESARTYALAFGLVYLVVAIWGFVVGDGTILGFLPLNMPDNVLHLVLGVAGLGAGASAQERRAAPAAGT